MHRTIFALAVFFSLTFNSAFAGELQTATLSGTINDSDKKPLAGATVMIFYAGVKKGYSTYCPSCYADCGKRTITDKDGAFSLKELDPNLWFTLLVVREGFAPTFIKKVDPAAGAISSPVPARSTPKDPAQLLRGRVLGPKGEPIADAVISPDWVRWKAPNGPTGAGGAVKGLDPIAISDEKGEFEVAFDKPGTTMAITIEARGFAPKHYKDLAMGATGHTLTLDIGATVYGRLLLNGKPVGGVQMGLCGRNREMGEFFSEVRIGTQPDGTFLFPNVPVPGEWYVYPKMESVLSLGAAEAVKVVTQAEALRIFSENLEAKVPDINLHPGRRVRGQVILTNGKQIPEGMNIGLHGDAAWDAQMTPLRSNGRFEFRNIPMGQYSISPSVKDYRLSRSNPNLSWTIEGFIDSDIEDLVILMEPGKEDFEGLGGGKFAGKPFRSAQRP